MKEQNLGFHSYLYYLVKCFFTKNAMKDIHACAPCLLREKLPNDFSDFDAQFLSPWPKRMSNKCGYVELNFNPVYLWFFFFHFWVRRQISELLFFYTRFQFSLPSSVPSRCKCRFGLCISSELGYMENIMNGLVSEIRKLYAN